MSDNELSALPTRMENSIGAFEKELRGLRAGRANPSLLDPVMVEVYGSMMPLGQVGTVSAPEPRMLSVSVWDKDNVKAVEKAIAAAQLGVNPSADGQLVRIPIPDMTEERRKEMVKVAGKYAEQTRINLRNIRRDGMDRYKKLEKDKAISEDELKKASDDIQKLTDKYVAIADKLVATKEKDIMSV
ncbi:MAG: ribosome recycling factor [Rickettsiales bacterium]|nr:ribosome recycling factor [Rickettsiales bacterium]